MANVHLGVRLAKSEIWNAGDGTNIAEVSERKFQQPSNIIIHEINVGGSVYLTPVSSRLFSKQGNLASYGSPYVILICAPQGKAAVSITGPFHSSLNFNNIASIRLLVGYQLPANPYKQIYHSSNVLGACIYELRQ